MAPSFRARTAVPRVRVQVVIVVFTVCLVARFGELSIEGAARTSEVVRAVGLSSIARCEWALCRLLLRPPTSPRSSAPFPWCCIRGAHTSPCPCVRRL